MLDAAVSRKRASKSVQQADDDVVTGMYLVPVIMFFAGITIVCGVLALDGPQSVLAYLASYIVSVPIGMAVYFIICYLWIGFDAPLHIIALRLAGIYAVSDASKVLLLLIPGFGPPLAIFLPLLIYIGLLMKLLEIEIVEAVVIGLSTWFIKIVVAIIIISLLT